MNNRKSMTGYVIALLFAGMAISCSKDQVLEPVKTTPDAADLQIKAVNDGNYHGEIVPLELAKLVAQKTEFQQLYGGLDSTHGIKGARVATNAKVIHDAVSLRDNHNQPVLHVINYEHGGFVVLSAERSALPVLAFSDDKSLNISKIPDAVNMWMEATKANVEQLRTENKASLRKSASESGMNWNNVLAMTGLTGGKSNPNARGPIDGPVCPSCPPEPKPDPCNKFWLAGQAGPYVATTWNQSEGYDWLGYNYNWYCPTAAGGPDGKALAGCGAVAGAQLMRYFRFPHWFNYNAMANTNATIETAYLIREVGRSAKSVYGAYETSTKTANLAQTFRDWGYSSVSHYDSYTNTDLTMALSSRPVILRGAIAEGSDVAHIWVCDGYKKIHSNCPTPQTYYWHMNWGWGGSGNGYYSDWGGLLNESTNKGTPGYNVFGAGRRMIRVTL